MRHLITAAAVEACCVACGPVPDNVALWEKKKKLDLNLTVVITRAMTPVTPTLPPPPHTSLLLLLLLLLPPTCGVKQMKHILKNESPTPVWLIFIWPIQKEMKNHNEDSSFFCQAWCKNLSWTFEFGRGRQQEHRSWVKLPDRVSSEPLVSQRWHLAPQFSISPVFVWLKTCQRWELSTQEPGQLDSELKVTQNNKMCQREMLTAPIYWLWSSREDQASIQRPVKLNSLSVSEALQGHDCVLIHELRRLARPCKCYLNAGWKDLFSPATFQSSSLRPLGGSWISPQRRWVDLATVT